ncbi:MAG: peptidoglycan-binding protein LysM [Rhodobacterales bacterium]|nr:MAG: peptidoglycan-binding protein LysM [Rhodobacterales bacterium]
MGLFSFFKRSGKRSGGGDTPTAEDLKKEVEELGLNHDGIELEVEDGKVKLSGNAVDVETREKIILAVGNVEGIAEVEDESEATAVFHTVEKGDTLSAIAKKTLGNANRYTEIFEANKPMLSHPDKIYPGQVLRIPQDASA